MQLLVVTFILCVALELVPRVSGHTHKTESWYLLRVRFKISKEQPPSFLFGRPPGEGAGGVLLPVVEISQINNRTFLSLRSLEI